MKKKWMYLGLLITAFGLNSCELIDNIKADGKIGGSTTPMSEVGNTFTVSGLAEATNVTAAVTALEGDVSEVAISMTLTDPTAKEIAKAIPDLNWEGDKISVKRKYLITDEGIQSVHDEGNLTMVKYDDKVGDTYSLKMNGKNVRREITSKSTDDDYPYAFFDIKVLKVEETGRGLPGVSKLVYFLNHRFGLVGIRVDFEDGSQREFNVFSFKENS